MIYHDLGPPGTAAIDHSPIEGVDPITEVGLDLQGGTPVINPVLQIASIPGMLRSLLTGNGTERV